MKKEDLIRKLTSRKLWVAIISFVTMMIVALGGTQAQADQTAALIMAGATILVYILAEGFTDASHNTSSETATDTSVYLEGAVETIKDIETKTIKSEE